MPKNRLKGTTQQRVLIFPALTPEVSGKRIHFLFSLSQVADIVRNAPVRQVPFSPRFVEGITRWRNAIVPVISLEVRLGLEPKGPHQARRRMVVQAAPKGASFGTALLGMLDVDPSMRTLSLPIECTATKLNGWIPRKDLIIHVFEWEEGFLVVPHMGKVLSAEQKLNASGTKKQKQMLLDI